MPILVVGSVAYDSVETPFGRREEILGGSATYFSIAASFFTPVSLVAVVGEDFKEEDLQLFRDRNIDISGLERAAGRTFRWKGKYGFDLNEAQTLDTQLNVFADFKPVIRDDQKEFEYVFLGNIDPELQRSVLEQIRRPKIVACDTMNYWIKGALEPLKRTLRGVDILIINDSETRQLGGNSNLVRAAQVILSWGPKALIVKRGEYGVVMFSQEAHFAAPAYPLEDVFDPTGAGDSFAGGFMGYLASTGRSDQDSLRKAIVFGSVMASFNVEKFSLERLRELTLEEIYARYRELRKFTQFEDL
ncbi:MAG: PfkB family carbohydrate kinase [Acidobacteriota bacterium]